jgi:Indigoidine synthase A like protein
MITTTSRCHRTTTTIAPCCRIHIHTTHPSHHRSLLLGGGVDSNGWRRTNHTRRRHDWSHSTNITNTTTIGTKNSDENENHESSSSISNNSTNSSSFPLLVIQESIQYALEHQLPVVALESTILAHGMPYPENLHLSQQLSTILRQRGVTPATIGTCSSKNIRLVGGFNSHPSGISHRFVTYSCVLFYC